jgi:uncharacterized protein (TIRG00374 family)
LSRRRRLVLLAGKAALAALLIGWLLSAGTLDLGALRLFFERPALLVADLALFGLGAVFGALRWRLLLRLADVRLPLGRALQLQLTAVFFNVVVPGNISGDVVKSVYVARQAPSDKRARIFLITFVDRLIAVAGLVVVALIAALSRGRLAWDHPQLRDLTLVVVVLASLAFTAPLVLLVVVRRTGRGAEQSTGGATRLARLLQQLLAAARLVLARPWVLVQALALSAVVYAAGAVLFAALATAVGGEDVSLAAVTSIYPLGMLTLVIPVSPAGIGVGHIAFDRLFAIVGLGHGATVFNIYLVGQIAPSLIGAVPYLALRRTAALVEPAPTGSGAMSAPHAEVEGDVRVARP